MEPAGLAIGVSQIVAQFQSCLTLYDQIMILKSFDADIQYFILSFDREKYKLDQLKEIVAHSKRSRTDTWIIKTLPVIENTLTKLKELISRYENDGAQGASRENALEEPERPKVKRSVTADSFKLTFLKKSAKKTAWVASDKRQIKELVERLKELNEDLASLIPDAKRVGLEYRLVAEPLAALDTPEDMQSMQAISQKTYPTMSHGAQIKEMGLRVMNDLPPSSADPPLQRFKLNNQHFQWSNDQKFDDVEDQSRAYGKYLSSDTTDSGVETNVLVEWRERFASQATNSGVEYRLDTLISMLKAMATKPPAPDSDDRGRAVDFSIPEPLGWIWTASQDRIGLVFKAPFSESRPPLSFYDHIYSCRRAKQPPPPLEERFDLAFGLAKTLGSLVAVGWVHKAFHSHNLLFFHKAGYRKLFLGGFTYARPQDVRNDLSLGPEVGKDVALYCPPNGKRLKTSAGDIYSLGIILLEIAFWYNIGMLVRKEKLDTLVADVGFRCGSIYQSVVRRCLACTEDNKTDANEGRALLSLVIEDLAACRA